jgi:hypothetical protein
MSTDERIHWLHDVSPADWIAPRLHDFAVDTGSIIPEGFDAYCRLFHPLRRRGPDAPSKSWAEVARENGRIAHPEMQIHAISQPVGSPVPKFDLSQYVNEMDWGELPLPERAALVELLRLATATPDHCWFCIWEGFGSLDFRGVSERVRLPNRNYVLYSGPIDLALASLQAAPPEIAAQLGDRPFDTHSPNLWWPDDRAWIVATEIDFAWTYVGGSPDLIRSILVSAELEALPAQLTDKPFDDSDTVNVNLGS